MILQELFSEQDEKQLVKIRRTLHQIPQIGLEEYQTSKLVRNYLSQIKGIQILHPITNIQTAIIAIIKAQNSQLNYLFRCQLDALLWPQQSGQSFSSNNGLHHACGHDAHMAIMILACKKIAENKNKLKRSIVFCFQPGQQGKGGAKKLIQNFPQLLDSVQYAFALHGGNHFPAGIALASPGFISANSERFQITIKGKGCHVMIPQNGIDANFIGCGLVTQLYSLKQMKLSPLERGIVSVTKVSGGLGMAIISENFHITGTLRMLTSKSQEKMKQQINNLTKNYCEGFGAESKVQFFSGYYRSVQNHETPTKIVKTVLKKILNQDNIKQQLPSFNGEDFCQFSERVQVDKGHSIKTTKANTHFIPIDIDWIKNS